MRRNTRYTPAYLLVLLAALLGFVLLWPRAADLQLPRFEVSQDVRQLAYDLDFFGLLPRTTSTPSAERFTAVAVAVSSPVPTVEPSPVVTATVAAPPAVATETATPPPTNYAYIAAAEVRHSNEDCPQPMIRGVVRNAAGELLPDVRIWSYDQFGNEDVVVTRLDEAERGQYSLAVSATTNIYYLQVVDAAGVLISPVVEVPHLQGGTDDALCHWLDWQTRDGG